MVCRPARLSGTRGDVAPQAVQVEGAAVIRSPALDARFAAIPQAGNGPPQARRVPPPTPVTVRERVCWPTIDESRPHRGVTPRQRVPSLLQFLGNCGAEGIVDPDVGRRFIVTERGGRQCAQAGPGSGRRASAPATGFASRGTLVKGARPEYAKRATLPTDGCVQVSGSGP